MIQGTRVIEVRIGRARAMGLVAVLVVLSGASTAWPVERVVVTPDAVVRRAPFEVAPELARLPAGTKVEADESPTGEWRRIRLPDGRFGLIHDTDLSTTRPSTTGQGADGAPLTVAPTPRTEAASAPPTVRPQVFGLMLSFLPAGTLFSGTKDGGASTTEDAASATAVAAYFDMGLSPFLSLGLSPQVILHVKAEDRTGRAATQYDVRGRITVGAPLTPFTSLFARVSPGLSIIDRPGSAVDANGNTVSLPNPFGVVVDTSVGTEAAVAMSKLFVIGELGYQLGLQSSSGGDLHTRYLHAGIGLAVRL